MKLNTSLLFFFNFHHPLLFDLPGHGENQPKIIPKDWFDVSEFMFQILKKRVPLPTQIIGVGNSMGAAILTIMQLLHPNFFSQLLLFDPIINSEESSSDSLNEELFNSTKRRKLRFLNKEKARENYISKLPFKSWDKRSLELYLEHGFQEIEADNQKMIQLKCLPEVEADCYYYSFRNDLRERLPQLQISKIDIVTGENSHRKAPLERTVEKRIPKAKFHVMKGVSHFLVMEDTVATAKLIVDLLHQDNSKL